MNVYQRREKAKIDKRAREKSEMAAHGDKSRYARKRRWLDSNPIITDVESGDGYALRGWEVRIPKPWR